jgi:hypothetical protein
VYADSVYEALSQAEDEVSRIAGSMFTKSETHAAMREYRFAWMRGLNENRRPPVACPALPRSRDSGRALVVLAVLESA